MVGKQIIRGAAHALGYEIRNKARPFLGDTGLFDRGVALVSRNTMLPNERMVSLFDQVTFCDRSDIAGAFVECGVWKGGAVGLMAFTTLAAKTKPRMLHLFDSFTDILEPDPEKDGAKALREAGNRTLGQQKGPTPMTGIYDKIGGHGTRHECQSLLEDKIGYPSKLIAFHEGWFQDTVPVAAPSIGRIAILRLDGDWYESTMVCLKNLFDNVVPGGFVIIDDYGTFEGCRNAVDEFLAGAGFEIFLNRVDAGCYYFVKPR